MELEEISGSEKPTTTTYEWFTSNPLANSCGMALTNLYCASRDYNRVTQCTIGGVESVVNYAAGTAKPVYEKVVEKLETPITTVDELIVGNLVKLEVKYPVVGEQPGEIAAKGKDSVFSTLQAGQEKLSNTCAGRLVGYSADVTITLAENLVEKMLPASDEEFDDEDESEEETKDDSPVSEENKSHFFLRKRKTRAKQELESEQEKEEDDNNMEQEQVESFHVETVSRSSRVYSLSQAVCYRSLRRIQRLQKRSMSSLQKLQASIDVLHYAQMMSSKVGEQRDTVTQALKDAEIRFKQFLTKQAKEDHELSELLGDQENEKDEDIKWLLESGKKKALYQWALEYSKSASKKVHEMMQSLSGITNYLPQGLRDGATNTIKQATDVYTTLKENNVPSELPRFMLSQVSEIIETQIVYCKQLGTYITHTLKSSFGKGDSNVDEPDEDEIVVDNEDGEEEEGEYESGSETYD